MNILEQKIDNILIIKIQEKEANLSIADKFKELVLQRIASGEVNIIVSFEHVGYLDSSFLGGLVSILKSILPLNGKLVLSDINSDILSLFELTRLDKIFLLKKSIEEAIKEFT